MPTQDEDTCRLVLVRDERSLKAFSELYARFAPKLVKFIRAKYMRYLDCDEMVQEILLTVWQKAHLFDPTKASAATWIFSIARNRRIDAMRRVVRPYVALDAARFVEDDHPSTDLVVFARQRDARIRIALRALPASHRSVIQLTFFAGQSYREAAATLGIPEGTVKSQVRFVLARLRRNLDDPAIR